jgi:hypothetical protein
MRYGGEFMPLEDKPEAEQVSLLVEKFSGAVDRYGSTNVTDVPPGSGVCAVTLRVWRAVEREMRARGYDAEYDGKSFWAQTRIRH